MSAPVPPIDSRQLAGLLATCARDVTAHLDQLLPLPSGPERRLVEAMRYGALGSGKRIRPFLVLESAALFHVSPTSALRVAAAVEMVHCYSLVHDDLPAMDNAELRRSLPTVHRQFDEATAILAGDALLTRAFEVLADPAVHGDAQVRIDLVRALAHAAGAAGMCGGQMLDLLAEQQPIGDIGAITRLQRLKTGEMIAFSAQAGAILGKAGPAPRHALHAYAHDLGLAFQIADDLLDVTATSGQTGKDTGKDEAAGKATFVSLLGVERARDQAQRLAEQAIQHLDSFGPAAEKLRAVARFVVERPN